MSMSTVWNPSKPLAQYLPSSSSKTLSRSPGSVPYVKHYSHTMFNQAKKVTPLAFIPKPIERSVLERTIELAAAHALEEVGFVVNPLPVDGCLYTRVGNKLKKIAIADIEHVEVDGKYCSLAVKGRLINCKISLRDIIEKLPKQEFVQISRSSIINLNFIIDIDLANQAVHLPSGEISIGRNFKDGLLSRLNLI